ncbi:hypothetical protein SLE2022_302440 [Rubroshorea leprosula]
MENAKHLVLVHGLCLGAWSWYKLIPLLKSSGHRVTALDLGASGINPKQLNEVSSMSDYVQPLMELMASLPEEEKVILVGHSYGGFGISLAMEKFPKKISASIFVTAFMPNSVSPPAILVEEFFKRNSMEALMDFQFWFDQGTENPPTSAFFGPQYRAANLYPNCKTEDLELAGTLMRPSGLFLADLAKQNLLTEENFGSLDRFFIVSDEDKLLNEDLQRWFIEKSPPKEVKVIEGADHLVPLSKPKELCLYLLEIADKYN